MILETRGSSSETYFNDEDEIEDEPSEAEREGLDDPEQAEAALPPRGQPQYQAANYPRVQAVGTKMLRRALAYSESQAGQVNDLWQIFKDAVLRHEYSLFVDTIADGIRADLRNAIISEQREILMKQAVEKLKIDIGSEVRKELTAELKVSLRADVEVKVREQLASEFKSHFWAQVHQQETFKIRQEVRAEMVKDPALLESVKQELKRSILGL